MKLVVITPDHQLDYIWFENRSIIIVHDVLSSRWVKEIKDILTATNYVIRGSKPCYILYPIDCGSMGNTIKYNASGYDALISVFGDVQVSYVNIKNVMMANMFMNRAHPEILCTVGKNVVVCNQSTLLLDNYHNIGNIYYIGYDQSQYTNHMVQLS